MSHQHTCSACNQSFNSEEELREHQRNAAHVVGKKGNEASKGNESGSGKVNEVGSGKGTEVGSNKGNEISQGGDRKENERPGSQQSGNQPGNQQSGNQQQPQHRKEDKIAS